MDKERQLNVDTTALWTSTAATGRQPSNGPMVCAFCSRQRCMPSSHTADAGVHRPAALSCVSHGMHSAWMLALEVRLHFFLQHIVAVVHVCVLSWHAKVQKEAPRTQK